MSHGSDVRVSSDRRAMARVLASISGRDLSDARRFTFTLDRPINSL